METSFLYMDEFYSEHKTFKHEKSKNRPEYVALTGLIVPAGIRSEFRGRFYRAVAKALDIPANTVPELPQIHGSVLFPEHPDDVKFSFLADVIKACVELDLGVVRFGYYLTPELKNLIPNKKEILGLCFNGMLNVAAILKTTEVWPVIEADQTADQDRIFAGGLQRIDFMISHIGTHLVGVDNSNLGELLYCSKRSIYGTTVDLISYLLDARFLRLSGIAVTEYKEKLASLAAVLEPMIVQDQIVRMNIEGSSEQKV